MTKLFLACQGSTVQQNAFISESEDADELGIPISKPKYPQYAVIEKRLESFKNWPCPGIKPELLVEAGFVYTGKKESFVGIPPPGSSNEYPQHIFSMKK